MGEGAKLEPDVARSARQNEHEERRSSEDERQKAGANPNSSLGVQESKSLWAKATEELKNLCVSRAAGEDMADGMDADSEVEVDDRGDEVRRGTRGVGMLWKISLLATTTLIAHLFLSGPTFEANLVPNIVERDPIPRISRSRRRRRRSENGS